MADPKPAHISHTESLAHLQEAGKVSGYQVPDASEHVTQNPSDLQQVLDAQIVTNADHGFPEDSAVELEAGPRQKLINVGNPTDSNTTAAGDNTGVFDGGNNTAQNDAGFDSFAPSTDNVEQQNYDSFFGGDAAATQIENENNDNSNAANGNANAHEDVFGGMDVNGNAAADNNDDNFNDAEQSGGGMNGGDIAHDEEDAKPTFLSVWQEEHREQLAEKAKAERAEKERQTDAGKKALDDFNEQRRLRIEQQRKDAQAREKDLREDYDSVFNHGSIWQQVAKLVDLQSDKINIERMRDLLIILKNADEQTVKGDK